MLQSNYIPWRGYFDLANDADLFIFYDEVKYTKNDWRNRNKICDRQGSFWLSIPIHKDAVKQRISEVELPEGWQEAHFKTIENCYKNAEGFSELKPLLEEMYLEKKWSTLSEMNRHYIQQISEKLGIKTCFENSAQYDLKGDRVERLVNLLEQAGCSEYISGPAAKNYLEGNEHFFSDKNITLSYKNYPAYPEYKQYAPVFERAVSILDLIAHKGFSGAPAYIWKSV